MTYYYFWLIQLSQTGEQPSFIGEGWISDRDVNDQAQFDRPAMTTTPVAASVLTRALKERVASGTDPNMLGSVMARFDIELQEWLYGPTALYPKVVVP